MRERDQGSGKGEGEEFLRRLAAYGVLLECT